MGKEEGAGDETAMRCPEGAREAKERVLQMCLFSLVCTHPADAGRLGKHPAQHDDVIWVVAAPQAVIQHTNDGRQVVRALRVEHERWSRVAVTAMVGGGVMVFGLREEGQEGGGAFTISEGESSSSKIVRVSALPFHYIPVPASPGPLTLPRASHSISLTITCEVCQCCGPPLLVRVVLHFLLGE